MPRTSVLFFLSCALSLSAGAKQSVVFPITSPPSAYSPFSSISQSIYLWGIPILATSSVDDADLQHAAGVLAQYLDNDEDGCPDDRNVVFQLNEYHPAGPYGVMVFKDDEEREDLENGLTHSQSTTYSWFESLTVENDIRKQCSGKQGTNSCFDGTLRSTFNLISRRGLASVSSSTWGEQRDSTIADEMDTARGGYRTNPPSTYPNDAVFTNKELGYSRQVRMFAYYSVTSMLGIHENRKLWQTEDGAPCSLSKNADNGDDCSEWKPRSSSLMKDILPDMLSFLETDLSHTLQCVCGEVGGKAPDGVYQIAGGIGGVGVISQCPDPPTRQCVEDDHEVDHDDDDDKGSGSFPWLLVLLITGGIMTCCCISWGVFLYIGKNMGDSDRRRAPKATKIRGKVPKNNRGGKKMVQLGQGGIHKKNRAGGIV